MNLVMLVHLAMVVVAFGLMARAVVLRRRDEAIAAVALFVAWLAATQDVPGDMPSEVEWLIAMAILGVCLVVAIGALSNRPVWLARRLSLNHVPVEAELDGEITRLVKTFNDLLDEGESTRPTGMALNKLRSRVEEIQRQLRALRAPSPEWDQLIRDYVSMVDIRLKYFATPLPDEAFSEFKAVNDQATARLIALRREYMRPYAKRP